MDSILEMSKRMTEEQVSFFFIHKLAFAYFMHPSLFSILTYYGTVATVPIWQALKFSIIILGEENVRESLEIGERIRRIFHCCRSGIS